MNLLAFEHAPTFAIEALRQGHFHYLETVSEAAEADLFRHLSAGRCLRAWRRLNPPA